MSVPTNPSFVDVLDTFYAKIADNLGKLTIPTSIPVKLKGWVNAQDWPQIEIVDGGLYLLYIQSVDIVEDGTRAATYYEHFLQWAWVFLGGDLASNAVGMNRASRHRDDMAVVEALRQAHFPGFCTKQFSSCDPASGTVTFTDYSPVEMIHWSMPKLGTKIPLEQNGVLYGAAPVEVFGWSMVNPLMDQ